jgi:hypothetical protein
MKVNYKIKHKGTKDRDKVHANTDDASPNKAVSKQVEQTMDLAHKQHTLKILLCLFHRLLEK